MGCMRIRLAVPSDLPAAAGLWHDRVALLQQSDSSIRLLPEAADKWRAAAESWIASENTLFVVAEAEGELRGFAAAEVVANRPGLHPARVGALLEMALDLHSVHSGLSERLLAPVRCWLESRGIHHLEIDAPARCPVEEAFWRARRASIRSNKFWLEL